MCLVNTCLLIHTLSSRSHERDRLSSKSVRVLRDRFESMMGSNDVSGMGVVYGRVGSDLVVLVNVFIECDTPA